MHPPIREATTEDAAAVSELVHSSFRKFIAPDWEQVACENLLAETSADKLVARIVESPIALVHEESGSILGVILLPRPTLVQLCFVAVDHVGKGIGRAMWAAARQQLEERFAETKTVELNSSPYAVAAYRSWGFYPISEQFVRGGAVSTRMACWLPGRALAAAKGAA